MQHLEKVGAMGGPVLGDVGQPELVWSIGGEVPLDKIVMDRRAGLAVEPPLLRVRREDPLGRAKPPDPTLGGDEPEVSQVVSDEPIADGLVGLIDVDRGVGEMGVIPVTITHRSSEPLVVALS